MSGRYIRLASDAFDAYVSGDTDGWLRYLHPEIVVSEPPELPDRSIRSGRAGALDAVEAWQRSWGEISFQLEDVRVFGDEVVLTIREHARGAASGLGLSPLVYFVLSMRDELVVSWQMFLSEEQALEAAGRDDGPSAASR